VTKQTLIGFLKVGQISESSARPSHVDSIATAVFFSLDLGFFCFIWGQARNQGGHSGHLPPKILKTLHTILTFVETFKE